MNAYGADDEQRALKELNTMLSRYGIPLRFDQNKNLLQSNPTYSPKIKPKTNTERTRQWHGYGTPPVTYQENPNFLKHHSDTKKSKRTKPTAKDRRLRNRSVSYVIAHKIKQPSDHMENAHTVIEMSQEESLVSKAELVADKTFDNKENEPHDSGGSPIFRRLLEFIGY
jgi:hypothetical protein